MESFVEKNNEDVHTQVINNGDNVSRENQEHSSSEEEEEEEKTVEKKEEQSSSEDSSSSSHLNSTSFRVPEEAKKPTYETTKSQKHPSTEMEMMKERFAKLLLGEDMSGSGNGVSSALAMSNAITNLCATIFGQIWRLEPLPMEKNLMWRREMEWLLSVSDHIVELSPSWQTFPDGTRLEVMTSRPRLDLYMNLPALRKLDNMLLEVLDSFSITEFWYVDKGIIAPEGDDHDHGSSPSTLRKALPCQEDKWWLPVPRVPASGLTREARKDLQHRRDCTNQILKAAMAINSNTLAEMEVPDPYLEALPKNAKACLGELIHREIASDQFSPEFLYDCLSLSSEHLALDVTNRVEASVYVWRQRNHANGCGGNNSRSSWTMVKDLVIDASKRDEFADRAESFLLYLKQKFPGLPQTTLDMCKIQYNKDVGKAILESYARVLESLAFNIVARIDDLLYVDDLTKHSDRFMSVSKVGQRSMGIPLSVAVPGTPCHTVFVTPEFSPGRGMKSPANGGERSPLVRPGGARRILTDYLMIESRVDFQHRI